MTALVLRSMWLGVRARAALRAMMPADFARRSDEDQQALQTLAVALATVTLTFLGFAAHYAIVAPIGAVLCLASALFSVGCISGLRAGHLVPVTHAVIGASILFVSAVCLTTAGPDSPAPIWAVSIAIVMSMVFPARVTRWWIVVIAATQTLLLGAYQMGWYNSALLAGETASRFEFALHFLLAPLLAGILSGWSAHVGDGISSRLSNARFVLEIVLDSVTTEFIMLDREGRLTQAPRQLDIAKHLHVGDRLCDFLSTQDDALCARFQLGFDALIDEFLPLELLLEQMPSDWSSRNRCYQLTYYPIYDVANAPWTRLAIAMTDVTEEREQERDEQRRDIAARIFHLLLTDRGGLLDFVAESERLLAQFNTEDADNRWLHALHTLKGNAGVFSLTAFAQTCHLAENLALAGSRNKALALVNDAWSQWRAEFDNVTSSPRFDGIVIDATRFAHFRSLIAGGAGHETLLDAAAEWSHQPLQRELERLASRAESIALRVDKPAPTLHVSAPNIGVDRARWRALWAAMIHTIRNAVDHGIEPPEERRALGKADAGRVSLTAELTDEQLLIRVSDDGRGIDWSAVRANAAAQGLDVSNKQDVRWLIADGVSTRSRPDEISGRGLGLAALAAAVAQLDGTLSVDSSPYRGCTWTLAFPRASMQAAVARRATPSDVNRAVAAAS